MDGGASGPPVKAILLLCATALFFGATMVVHKDSLVLQKQRPAPTTSPTASPSPAPTSAPTASPTPAPTSAPTAAPTASPTVAPGAPSLAPTSAPTPAPGAQNAAPERKSGAVPNDIHSATFWFYYGLVALAMAVGIWALCAWRRAGGCIDAAKNIRASDAYDPRPVINVSVNTAPSGGEGGDQYVGKRGKKKARSLRRGRPYPLMRGGLRQRSRSNSPEDTDHFGKAPRGVYSDGNAFQHALESDALNRFDGSDVDAGPPLPTPDLDPDPDLNSDPHACRVDREPSITSIKDIMQQSQAIEKLDMGRACEDSTDTEPSASAVNSSMTVSQPGGTLEDIQQLYGNWDSGDEALLEETGL
jgi:hypothetical protein